MGWVLFQNWPHEEFILSGYRSMIDKFLNVEYELSLSTRPGARPSMLRRRETAEFPKRTFYHIQIVSEV